MQVPKSCTLTPSDGVARAAELRSLARRALRARERDYHHVVLSFSSEPGVAAAVADLARRERECCPFLDLRVSDGPGGVTLSIGAAAEDRAALDAFSERAGG